MWTMKTDQTEHLYRFIRVYTGQTCMYYYVSFAARYTVMILRFRKDRFVQTVQTQIRLLLEQTGSTLFAILSALFGHITIL